MLARVYIYYALGAIFALLIIAVSLLGMLILDCVNRKLPKDMQLAWWSRWSIVKACSMYKWLYPKGHLATAFWICFLAEFVIFAGMFFTRPRWKIALRGCTRAGLVRKYRGGVTGSNRVGMAKLPGEG